MRFEGLGLLRLLLERGRGFINEKIELVTVWLSDRESPLESTHPLPKKVESTDLVSTHDLGPVRFSYNELPPSVRTLGPRFT